MLNDEELRPLSVSFHGADVSVGADYAPHLLESANPKSDSIRSLPHHKWVDFNLCPFDMKRKLNERRQEGTEKALLRARATVTSFTTPYASKRLTARRTLWSPKPNTLLSARRTERSTIRPVAYSRPGARLRRRLALPRQKSRYAVLTPPGGACTRGAGPRGR